MRTFVVGLVGVAVLVLGVVAASGAATTTYQGTFSGAVTYENCPGPDDVVASGTWSVAVHGDTATAAFNIFTQEGSLKRKHHVAYGGTFPNEGSPFDFEFMAGPNPVHVSLNGSSFSYVVGPPYIAFGLECQDGVVTYTGTTK